MEPSDEALVIACRQGDAAAWEALVERYQLLIYTIVRRAGLDEDLSDDVFQRVLTRLVEHLDRIEQPAQIGAWLVTTARHETWRVIRREKLSNISISAVERSIAPLVDDGPLPEEVLLRLEEQHKVRTAVAALDQRCRRLLLLLFYQPDLPSYTQIATALGMNEGSIGPTRARCLQKLRRLLDDSRF